MRRIYFLVPDIEVTKHIVNELLLARIEEKHIHVIAKPGTPLEDLPEASLMQKSDFIPAVQQGLAVGGTTGAIAGLVAVALPPASTVVAGGLLLGGLAGASIGAWASGLIGVSTDSRRIKEFEEAIKAGHLLVLADVHADRVEEIEALVRQHVPEVEVESTEPKVPAFP
jgi:hypothetical protein